MLGCCSDTHGSSLPRWGEPGIAAVLHAGDVYDAPTLIEDDDDPAARHWAASAGVPVFAVRGNHDYLDPGGFFRAAQDLTGACADSAPASGSPASALRRNATMTSQARVTWSHSVVRWPDKPLASSWHRTSSFY